MKPVIYTSGIYNNDIDYNEISNYINKLVFDIPTEDCKLYKKLCGGDLIIVLDSIRKAIKANINIELNVIITGLNLKDIKSLLMSPHHQKINLLRLYPHGRCIYNQDLIPSKDNIDDLLKFIYDNNIENIRMGIPIDHKKKCVAGFNKAIITCNGNVYPCDTFKNIHSIEENITPLNIKNNNLIDCINGEYFTLVKKRVKDFNCSNCKESCYAQHIININKEEIYNMKNYLILQSLLTRLPEGTNKVEVIIPCMVRRDDDIEEIMEFSIIDHNPVTVDVNGVIFTIYDDFYDNRKLQDYEYTDVRKFVDKYNGYHNFGFIIYYKAL